MEKTKEELRRQAEIEDLIAYCGTSPYSLPPKPVMSLREYFDLDKRDEEMRLEHIKWLEEQHLALKRREKRTTASFLGGPYETN